MLNPDRLLPSDPGTRSIARRLYEAVRGLPLYCPHTHIDARVLAEDLPFGDPLELFVTSDHYVIRILMSQGIRPEEIGIASRSGDRPPAGHQEAWRTFARNWHLFRGTPTEIWIDQQLVEVFGVETRLSETSADETFDRLSELLASPDYRPRALFERFGIEQLATTDAAHVSLNAHEALHRDGWGHRVVPAFRPDQLVDVDREGWARDVFSLAALSSTDTQTFDGFLQALRLRRAEFIRLGAIAADHGLAIPLATRSTASEMRALYRRALSGPLESREAAQFRAHMLMEFAEMSSEDGLVMQLHAGSTRNHDRRLFNAFGPDMGADIPHAVDMVHGLAELLNEYGNDGRFKMVVFTLDESVMSRELAPMAAHYPALRLGAPWWFLDSPEGMRRHRDAITGIAGFYNGCGFIDDARCFTSIPARHDMARRVDSAYLAQLVAEHRLDPDQALELAHLLAAGQAHEVFSRRSEPGSQLAGG